jgi:hypothetical protein
MIQDQAARLRIGHKRYGGVQNSHETGDTFVCDRCGDVERSGMKFKYQGMELCEECAKKASGAANAENAKVDPKYANLPCPKGGVHDWESYRGSLGYETAKCRKCGQDIKDL